MGNTAYQSDPTGEQSRDVGAIEPLDVFDPTGRKILWRGIGTSWVVHVVFAAAMVLYGFELQAQGDLKAVVTPHTKRPIPVAFEFPAPVPDLRPHLVPQVVAETVPEPSPEMAPEPDREVVQNDPPKKRIRTARRTRHKARPAQKAKLPTPIAAAVAPPVANATATTVAPEAVATPMIASGPSTVAPPTPSTVGEKSTVDRAGLMKAYVKTLSKAVRKRRAYPRAAKLAGLEGRAVVRIVLDEAGSIVEIALAQSSGHDILDRAALEAARSVGRLPAAPSGLHWGTRAIKVPFRFTVTT